MTRWPLFKDRFEAGQMLAQQLGPYYAGQDVLVLALPRGGTPIGSAIAEALGAPLDVLVVRKLSAPYAPEYGVGALAEGGVMVGDLRAARAMGISDDDLQAVAANERKELERRVHLFRGERPMPDVAGKTVILADDGSATGLTALAAAESLRHAGARSVVLAVPICSLESARLLQGRAQVVCVYAPLDFRAIGDWYESFPQLTDQEVLDTLRATH